MIEIYCWFWVRVRMLPVALIIVTSRNTECKGALEGWHVQGKKVEGKQWPYHIRIYITYLQNILTYIIHSHWPQLNVIKTDCGQNAKHLGWSSGQLLLYDRQPAFPLKTLK